MVELVTATLTYQLETIGRPALTVVFMDWRDQEQSMCRLHDKGAVPIATLVQLLGPSRVWYVTEQIVVDGTRRFQQKQNFTTMGRISNRFGCFDWPVLQVPYTVRSDMALPVQQTYPSYLPPHLLHRASSNNTNNTNTTTPADTERLLDVASFWKISKPGIINGELRNRGTELRNRVTKVVQTLNGTVLRIRDENENEDANTTTPNGTSHTNTTRLIRTWGDLVSAPGRLGRTTLQDSYVEALLTTKIIVTAQRTEWEDHYRLFEAIIGGGLVMTDPMYTMPPGYRHGENIIIYHSLEELKHYILSYLEHPQEQIAIATKGWQLAMEQHRTYHWMERIFFGTPLTP
jgi:hypothetical protein